MSVAAASISSSGWRAHDWWWTPHRPKGTWYMSTQKNEPWSSSIPWGMQTRPLAKYEPRGTFGSSSPISRVEHESKTWKTAKQLSRFYGNSIVVQFHSCFSQIIMYSNCIKLTTTIKLPATFRRGNPRDLYYSARSRAECIQSCTALDTWDWKNPWVHMPTLYTHPAKIMFALALGSLSQIGIKLIKHATFLRPPVNHGLNGSPIQHGELSPPKGRPKGLYDRENSTIASFRQTSSRDS